MAASGPRRLLDRVAPGLRYDADVVDRLVLVTCARAAPIVVGIDEVGQTVVLHPPLDTRDPTPADRLRELGRALGDQTRIRVLERLREGDLTLPELCEALGSPRTTLLHHLALLRAAGLVDLRVRGGTRPNSYSLAEDGFEQLVLAARAFTTRSQVSKNLDT